MSLCRATMSLRVASSRTVGTADHRFAQSARNRVNATAGAAAMDVSEEPLAGRLGRHVASHRSPRVQ